MANKKEKEPEIVLRPLGKFGGLDSIHISLIFVIVLMTALLLTISYSKPELIIKNATNSTCTGYLNGTRCTSPIHTKAQILIQSERLLASYNYVNTSLSVLPYYSDIKNATISFLPDAKSWYVRIPSRNPNTNSSFYISFVFNDNNLSATPYIQTIKPNITTDNLVVAKGVVQIANKFDCLAKNPTQSFLFLDPYSPGAIQSLINFTSLQAIFTNKINSSIKVLFGTYSAIVAQSRGTDGTQALGKYILCASLQANFNNFVLNLNSAYSSYVSPNTLAFIANYSKLNMTVLSNCIANSTTLLNKQTLLAQYYNITTTPAVIVNCKYLALPQTEKQSLCYANSTLC